MNSIVTAKRHCPPRPARLGRRQVNDPALGAAERRPSDEKFIQAVSPLHAAVEEDRESEIRWNWPQILLELRQIKKVSARRNKGLFIRRIKVSFVVF